MPDPSSAFEPIPRCLPQEEVARFFAAIEPPRDRALFSLVYLYALRVSEVALLLRRDVDFEHTRITIKRVKRGYWSIRPLLATAADLLTTYLAPLYLLPDAPLFPGRYGALKKRQIQTLFGQYRDRAGLASDIGCHSLRHSIATHMLEGGFSLKVIQDHLGHRNVRSTSIYTRVTDRYREAVFERLETSPSIVRPGASVGPNVATCSKEA